MSIPYNKYGRFNFNTRYRLADRLSFGLNGNFNRGGNRSFFYWKSDIEGYQGSPNTYSTSDRFRFNLDPHLTYFDKSGNRHRILGRLYRVDNNLEEGRSNQSWQHYAEYQVQRNLKAWDMVITGGAVVSGSHVDAELYGDTTFTSRNYAVYLQADKKFFERLNISGGFRFEDNLLINPGFTYALGMVEPSREREAKPVFRLGMNYQLMEASFLRASYGQGYRYPTIAEKFIFTDVGGFFVRPNPTLRSETGWSTEVGLKQGFRISSFEGYLDLSAFWFKYFNMMEFNLVATGGRAAFQATNIGDTETRGYEVTMAGRGKFFGLPTSLLAGYVYIDPRFLEFDLSPVLPGEPQSVGQVNAINSSSEDNILKYRSRHNLKFDLESNWKAFMLGLEYFHSSDMEAIDRIFNIIVPGLQRFREANDRGYHLCNARAAYRFSEKFRFSMLLNNIFNEVYSVRPGMLDAPRNLTAKVDVAF
jgi:outer membrane receptor protein involved in Fe transport